MDGGSLCLCLSASLLFLPLPPLLRLSSLCSCFLSSRLPFALKQISKYINEYFTKYQLFYFPSDILELVFGFFFFRIDLLQFVKFHFCSIFCSTHLSLSAFDFTVLNKHRPGRPGLQGLCCMEIFYVVCHFW